MSKQRQHDVTMIIPTSEEQQPTHFDSNPPLTMHRKKSMQNRQVKEKYSHQGQRSHAKENIFDIV